MRKTLSGVQEISIISSPEPTGELIGYPWSGVRLSTISNIYSSETAWPIKAKFYVEPGTKVYINDPCHMTKMAAMPIYGKNPSKIFFSRTRSPMILKLGMQHQGLKLYKVYINGDPGLTLTYFTARSIWFNGALLTAYLFCLPLKLPHGKGTN